MKANKKNLLALLLAAAMIAPALTACGNGEGAETDHADTSAAPVETETERIYADDIADDVDFDGATVKFMWWAENEEFADEQNGEVVNDAMFDRDMSVETRLNVNIENIGESYTWDTKDVYLGKIRSSVMANDGAYDVASGQYATLPGLVPEGNFTDMTSLPYLDFSKPYWVQQLIEETSIGGKLYLASGDITTMTISTVFCILYNETLRENLGVEPLTELAVSGNWTRDKMMEAITGTYADLDGDNMPSAGDRYGIAFTDDNTLTPFIQAFDLQITTMKDGYPELSFNNEKVISVAEFMADLIYRTPESMVDLLVLENFTGGEIASNMLGGNILFYVGTFNNAQMMTEMDDEFGLLPLPKWDENQDKYRTALGESNTLFGILASCANKDATAAALEMMAAESYRLVSPALYEITLKTRYAADSEMSRMFDLIRDGVTFNFGSIYTFDLNRLCVFFKETIALEKGWASTWAAQEDATKAAIDEFFDKVSSLEQ